MLLLGIEKDDNKKAPKEVTETTKDEPSAITEPEVGNFFHATLVQPNADQSPKKERPAIAAPEVPEGEKKAVSSEGDARAKRALRFGLPVEPVKSPPEAKANGQEKKPEIKTTDPKLLARAKRFGLPVVSGLGRGTRLAGRPWRRGESGEGRQDGGGGREAQSTTFALRHLILRAASLVTNKDLDPLSAWSWTCSAHSLTFATLR